MSAHKQTQSDVLTVAQLSLADGIVLVQFMGVTDAARLISLVDPWCYPGSSTPASIGIKRYVQSAVDKAASKGKTFCIFRAERVSAYLLSPLLVPNGERPSLLDLTECKRGRRADSAVLKPVVPRTQLMHAAPVEVSQASAPSALAWLAQGTNLSVRRYWLCARERAPLRTGYMPKSWPRKGARIIKYISICSFCICASFETGRS